MALFEMWHVGLLENAISRLGSAPELDEFVVAMDEMRSLGARAAVIYAERPLFGEELGRMAERRRALADEVGPIGVEAGAPTCAAVVVLQ